MAGKGKWFRYLDFFLGQVKPCEWKFHSCGINIDVPEAFLYVEP